jgi:hypothetical protein
MVACVPLQQRSAGAQQRSGTARPYCVRYCQRSLCAFHVSLGGRRAGNLPQTALTGQLTQCGMQTTAFHEETGFRRSGQGLLMVVREGKVPSGCDPEPEGRETHRRPGHGGKWWARAGL